MMGKNSSSGPKKFTTAPSLQAIPLWPLTFSGWERSPATPNTWSMQTLCFPPFRDSWKTIRNPPKSCCMPSFSHFLSPAEIVICGERNDERTQALIKKSIGASFPLPFSCFMTPKNRMRNSSRLRLFSSIRKWRMVCQPSSFAGTKLAIGPKTASRPWPSASTKP